MKEIHRGLLDCLNNRTRAVLATIIQVEGSSYRREGARCLIVETGEVIGMISGGCVESDLFEHSMEVLTSHQAKKILYDFRWDEDDLWGMGIGCNGAISVWLEPFDPINEPDHAKKVLVELSLRLTCEESYTCATVIESSRPDRIPIGHYLSSSENPMNLKSTGKSELVEAEIDEIKITVFIEQVKPLPKLFIIGSGPDAALLAKRANELDWRVTVIDHREQYLSSHFPNVEHSLITRGNYSAVDIPLGSYAIVMTHNLDLDRLALQHLLTVEIPYIGVLGSRQRMTKLISMLKEGSEEINELIFKKIHAPVGLDIGAESPDEITLSILSELIAHKNGRLGGSLCKVIKDK